MGIRVVIAAVAAVASASALCGQQTGQITRVVTRASDGLVYFYVSGSPIDRPACATHPYWVIKDENSAAGKRQLAVLLAAQTTGRQIAIHGFNACARWSDGEDVNTIELF